MAREVVVVSAVRTAIGKLGGALSGVPVCELGATAIREALARAGVAGGDVDEVIMGHVLQAGTGLNPARQAALRAGLPVAVPAFTVNKVCASGMKAFQLAATSIALGEADIVVAGGMENMSAAPFLLDRARWGYRLGHGELRDVLLIDALVDPGEDCHMGITAENLAAEFGIGRDAQDAFAFRSQRKTAQAIASGAFTPEIVPVSVPQKRAPDLQFDADEFPRPGTSLDVLSTLKPAFLPDGTVTAGNASGINDGAAAMVLMSSEQARQAGLKPMANVLACAAGGVEPARMGMGPVPATRRALERASMAVGDIDVIELNEAFAVQSLAVMSELGLDEDKVNPKGGAIALGHPVGASGARILVTLLHTMVEGRADVGLATLCVGGGQGMAAILSRRG